MFKNIMLAVDGSTYTDSVLAHGIELARAFHSRLQVITVADIRVFEWATAIGADGFVPIVPSGIYQDESRKLMEEKCHKVLEKCAEVITKENIEFETEKVVGAPTDSILERSQLADLVIMGKRGEFARWDKKRLGATVESVSRSIRKPILVVKKEYRPIKRILVGYDGSEHANKALQCVGNIGEATMAKVTVLHITDDRELGVQYCKEAERYLKSYKITVGIEMISGIPKKGIVQYARENNYDLIAIGAYGHSRIREALLGSNTEYILSLAECPVLLAK